MSWRLGELTSSRTIALDYEFIPEPRWGYGKKPHPELYAIFNKARPAYEYWLAQMVKNGEAFFKMAEAPEPGAGPTFENGYFTGLDAMALYSVLATERPRTYLEVGSGNSTKFARKAIRDNNLPTKIVSIDPRPRADVELLCDQSIRCRFEDADPSHVESLEAGDIIFIDNSHRSFQNSDVTVFFLETLPRLKPGVIVHIHDIMLPYDYPKEWKDRYFSEQYLLGCWLLANPKRLQLMLSNVFVTFDPELSRQIAPVWDNPRFSRAKNASLQAMKQFMGQSIWARVGAAYATS